LKVAITDNSTGRFLNLFGIEFVHEFENERFKLRDCKYSFMDVICIVDSLFRYINSINKKGFVNECDLDNSFMNGIMDFLRICGYEDKILGNSEYLIQWGYNFIFINCYYLVLEQLKCLKDQSYEDLKLDSIDDKVEVLYELEYLHSDLLQRLDQYMRGQLVKRGITVVQNTYCGFSKNLNKLVSVQTAVKDRTILKIPLYNDYNISYVNPLSSEISDVFVNKVNSGGTYQYTFQDIIESEAESETDVFVGEFGEKYDSSMKLKRDKKIKLNEIFTLNHSLKICISKIRKLLFKDLHGVNTTLINFLKVLSKLDNF